MKIDLQATLLKKEKKGDIKRLRKEGKIPAVLYGHGEETRQIYVELKEFRNILSVLKKEAITVNLKVGGKSYVCVIKTIQHNPVTGELLHIDFQHIHKKEKIKAVVPIHSIGEPPGVEQGGILDIHLHEIVVRCLPDEMPSHIDVDISNLGIGQTIHLADITLPNVEFELTLETSVVSILAPRKIEEVKPVEVEEVVGVAAEEGEEAEVEEGVEGKEVAEGKKGEKGAERKERGRGKK